jgi:S-adenosylmethionine:tRNA ribosyltransferase-isomerase
VTLHVGAGTFKPVKAEKMKDHEMHAEYIDVSKNAINQVLNNTSDCIPVGTTALRTIETIFWLGVKTFLDPELKFLSLDQWDVYSKPLTEKQITKEEALTALLTWMEKNNKESIFTQTRLMIAPGYRFRIANALITNFHQPNSTLLLLVAAAIGDDWKKIYNHALNNEYRFLSYGDANLLYINSREK